MAFKDQLILLIVPWICNLHYNSANGRRSKNSYNSDSGHPIFFRASRTLVVTTVDIVKASRAASSQRDLFNLYVFFVERLKHFRVTR